MSEYRIKGETLTGIADAIRKKTGGTEPIPVPDMAAQIEGISGGGSSAEIDILQKQTLEFAYNSDLGSYAVLLSPAPVTLEYGTEYYVEWDGEVFLSTTCNEGEMSLDGAPVIFMGNTDLLGGASDGQPYAIGYIPAADLLAIMTADDSAAHTIRIYQKQAVVSDELKYVTFMSHDGTVELGKKAVAVGDDCADPITRGVFDKPTRESDAQYDYDHIGWSKNPDNVLDDTALDAVTEDRVVYAVYAATVRYYSVRFWDGETLHNTVQVPYGGSASCEPPSKEGYFFDCWEPAPENITGDMDCYAQWKVNVDFATGTWAEITSIAEAGEAANYFEIGDTKDITFTSPDGSSYTMPVEIIAFGEDELSDGTKAGITMRIKQTAGFSSMNSSKKSENGKSGYYVGGWEICDMRSNLESITLASMDESLRNAIEAVKKVSNYYVDGTTTTGQKTTYDKLWLFSASELSGVGASSYGLSVGEGSMYNSFKTGKLSPKAKDAAGTNMSYALRTGCYNSNLNCGFYNTDAAGFRAASAAGVCHIMFGFCIGRASKET